MKTFEQIGENCYDKDGKLLGSTEELGDIPDETYELKPIVEIDDERTELEEWVAVDWKASPSEVMNDVNGALKQMGIDVEFIQVEDGSDCYRFGVKDK